MADDILWTYLSQIMFKLDLFCKGNTYSIIYKKLKERDFPIKCPFPECKETVEYADLVETLDDNELELYN
jgi:hypothetical protein